MCVGVNVSAKVIGFTGVVAALKDVELPGPVRMRYIHYSTAVSFARRASWSRDIIGNVSYACAAYFGRDEHHQLRDA